MQTSPIQDPLVARISELESELADYKHAFETTAVDRDRLAELLRSIADPLDAGYFRFDLSRLLGDEIDPPDKQAIDGWDRAFAAGNYADLLRSFIAANPIGMAFPLGEEYCRPFSAYLLACFYAAARDFERASAYAEMIEFDAPPDGSDLLPYDIRQGSRLAYYKQTLAIERQVPNVAIVSLTKSASSFVSANIAKALDVPVLKMSVGQGYRSVVCKRWASQVAKGGAVTHEHFSAAPENIKALLESGTQKLFIQIRDPRDAAFSLIAMHKQFKDTITFAARPTADVTRADTYILLTTQLATWIEEWIHVQGTGIFPVEFITYNEVVSDFPSVFTRLTGRSAPEFSATTANFRKGTGDEWRDAFPADVRSEAWNSIARPVIELLEMKE